MRPGHLELRQPLLVQIGAVNERRERRTADRRQRVEDEIDSWPGSVRDPQCESRGDELRVRPTEIEVDRPLRWRIDDRRDHAGRLQSAYGRIAVRRAPRDLARRFDVLTAEPARCPDHLVNERFARLSGRERSYRCKNASERSYKEYQPQILHRVLPLVDPHRRWHERQQRAWSNTRSQIIEATEEFAASAASDPRARSDLRVIQRTVTRVDKRILD